MSIGSKKQDMVALKENASDKILVALQRYKIAVQHYGKRDR